MKAKRQCSFLVVLLACTSAASADWDFIQSLNTARQHHGAAQSNGSIYVAGGYPVAGNPLSSVERYDPSSNAWVFVAPMNTPRASHGMTAVGGFIYAISGHDGNSVTGTVEIYSPSQNAWSYSPHILNVPRSLFAVTKDHNAKIYVIGGNDSAGNRLASVEVFDPSNAGLGWQLLQYELNDARAYLGAGTDGLGRIYAIAGVAGPGFGETVTVERFDPSNPTQGWVYGPSLSQKRQVGAYATDLNGAIYVVAGWAGGFGPHLSSVEVYELSTDTWRQDVLPDLNRSINNFAAAFDALGRLYAIGGEHFDTQDEVERINVAPGAGDPPDEPQYDEPQAAGETNAVIITHGWNPSFNPSVDFGGFWVPLTQEIAEMTIAPGDWFVGAYNWVADATTLLPDTALNRAQAHGDFLGQWLADQQFDHVHLIAHSAGSALIGRAAYWLSVSPQRPTIHTTFLDPFSGVFVGPSGGYQSLYGGSSDWSDNYFSFDLLTGSPTYLDDLPWSFNVDVTRVDPDWNPILHPFSSHSWPRCFYRFTVSEMTLDCNPLNEPPCTTGELGFPLGREVFGGTLEKWLAMRQSAFPVGQLQTLTCPSPGPEGGSEDDLVFRVRQDDPLNFADLSYQTSTADSVIVSDVGFTATTFDGAAPSAAWINIAVELTQLVNFVRFDVEFVSDPGARGLLTVYLDGIELGFVDEQYFQPGFNEYSLQSADLGAGSHSLSFRLDPFTAIPSVVTVSNVATGRGTFTCASDLNVDDEVGIVDFLMLLAAWGPCPDPPEPCPADIDGDGNVGIVDFLALLANWGPCP